MTEDLRIYQTEPDATIQLLSELDSRPCPRGRMLVAAVAGNPRAALPLDGGPAVADPFHPTAELVSLLEMRAAHLRGQPSRRRGAVFPTWLPRRRPLAAPRESGRRRENPERRHFSPRRGLGQAPLLHA